MGVVKLWNWIKGLFVRKKPESIFKKGGAGQRAQQDLSKPKIWKNGLSGDKGGYLVGLCPKCGKRMWSLDLSHVCRKRGRCDAQLRFGRWIVSKGYKSPLWQRPVIGRRGINGSNRTLKVFGHLRWV